MNARARDVLLLLVSMCVAPAAAQQVPTGDNPYARKRAKPLANVKVDPALERAVREKVTDCYEQEQRQALSKEDAELLRVYGADVVRELADALAGAGCVVGQRAGESCVERVEAMDCEKLAAPIVKAGWDRNLSPQARTQVADYAGMLARREARCSGYEAEDSQLITGVRSDRLATLIESQIVIGQCQLFPERLAACASELDGMTCQHIMALNEKGALQQICKVLECTNPAEVAKTVGK
jgi:hypothetical protein